MNRGRSLIPQEAFPDMPIVPFPPVRVEARNALARALTPGYVGIREEEYLDITPELMRHADAAAFRPSLIDLPASSEQGIVRYQYFNPDNRSSEWISVAVTPAEFLLMNGSIRNLGNRAMKRVEKARTPMGQLPTSVDVAASVRGGVHAVERLVTDLGRYKDNDLERRIQLIVRFQEAANHPGLARFGSEGQLREALTTLREQLLGDMFTVLSEQRGWTTAQQTLAIRTVDKRLFLDAEKNRHIGYAKDLFALLAEWYGHKLAIVNSRIWEARKYIKQQQGSSEHSR